MKFREILKELCRNKEKLSEDRRDSELCEGEEFFFKVKFL